MSEIKPEIFDSRDAFIEHIQTQGYEKSTGYVDGGEVWVLEGSGHCDDARAAWFVYLDGANWYPAREEIKVRQRRERQVAEWKESSNG